MTYGNPNKEVKIIRLGLADYQETWDYQQQLFDEIVDVKLQNRNSADQKQTPNYLITCEHPLVYTLGKSGSEEHLLLDEQALSSINASFYKINRGGDITHHGPGQLVVYPVFDLENFFTDIHLYLRQLEEAVILTLADFGIAAERYEGYTGVWIDSEKPTARKICAMGVKCGRWVTMHGLALNVSNDLSFFNHIVPCGITDKAVTSVSKELGTSDVSVKDVEERLLFHLGRLFGFTYHF
jgi:lipoyl(octanoyl) transferase